MSKNFWEACVFIGAVVFVVYWFASDHNSFTCTDVRGYEECVR